MKIIDHYMEFNTEFKPYDGVVTLTLVEITQTDEKHFNRHSKLVTSQDVKLLNWLGHGKRSKIKRY